MKSDIYNQQGKKTGSVDLPESVFGVKWNPDLVHQVVSAIEDNARTPTAHTKDRSEVRGGGAKPWRQKGTGRARHGSRRSPLWAGGGVTFGPRNEKSFAKKINKKMRKSALYSVLSAKLADGEIIFVDSLDFEKPKTKDAKSVLESVGNGSGNNDLSTKKKNAALVAVFEKDENLEKSFANIGSIGVAEVRNLNPLALLTYKYVIIDKPEESVQILTKKASKE